MRKQKKKKKNIPITFIIYIILFAILIYSGIKICKWYKDNMNNSRLEKEINTAVVVQEDKQEEKYIIDFDLLKKKNDETVAWIAVNNTNVKYPVVKTKNNEFYLNHSFDRSNNKAGWIFADYRNKFDGTDKNIIIYGHNRRDESMFGSLKNILNSDWYNNTENGNIILNTENENYIYKVFSVYKIEAEDYYIRTEFKNDEEFEEFAKNLKKRSIKDFGVEVSKSDSILTLSTCANNNKNRVVLHAKLNDYKQTN